MRIYLCPSLMDWAFFLVTLAVFYGAGERKLSLVHSTWLAASLQILYMGASLLVGRLLHRGNARSILIASTVLTPAFGVVSLLLTSYWPLLIVFSLMGLCLAFFFNSFQTYMRGEAAPGRLSRAVGAYTLAWSMGSAFGLLSGGSLYRWGTVGLIALLLLVSAVVLGILLSHRPRPHEETSADESVESGDADARAVNPAYVLVGWIMVTAVVLTQRPLQTLFPVMCAKAQIPAFWVGFLLFLHMALQGIVGFLMERCRFLYYRRTPLWIAQGLAVALFLVMWKWPAFPVCFACITILGAIFGFGFFFPVFYASNSGRRSFNIGINEFLVGFGSLVGLLASNWWIGRSDDAGMYVVFAIAFAAALALQHIAASRPAAGKA